jgi:hypothetical protein
MPSMTRCIQCLAVRSCAAQFQGIRYLSDSEGRSNKTIIFTTYKQRHCVGVSPKVLQINLNLLRKIPVIEEMTVRWEFLPDLTRIMNETKMTLLVKHFKVKVTMKRSVPTSSSGVPSVY